MKKTSLPSQRFLMAPDVGRKWEKRAKSAAVALIICVFVCTTSHSYAVPILTTDSTTASEQGGDWLMELVAIVGLGAALGSLIVAISNSPTKPPRAEATAVVQADQNGESDHSIFNPAQAIASASGNRGSSAFGNLTVTNTGRANQSSIGTWNADNSRGTAAKGGSSSGTLTGKLDGGILVERPISPQALLPAIDLATLTFTPTFTISDFSSDTLASSSELSADLMFDVAGSSSSPYHWGFSTSLGPDGKLSITDRRGLFSDADLVLSGNAIIAMTPPEAIFLVPLDTELDYSGALQLSAAEARASEANVPEPSTFWLALIGLLGVLACRYAGALRMSKQHRKSYTQKILTYVMKDLSAVYATPVYAIE